MTPKQFRMIRLRGEYSMNDLTAFLGVTKGAISKWESGARPIPGPVARLMLLLDEGGIRLFEKVIGWE